MHCKHIIYRSVLAAALATSGAALGNGPLEWSATDFDFGTIAESDGMREGAFTFRNVSALPLRIRNVKTSCGCTEARYPLESVEPGAEGKVSFTFNPARRPGRLDKTLRVYYTQGDDPTLAPPDTLHFRGLVIATPETLGLEYPDSCGRLRLSSTAVNLKRLTQGTSRHGFVQVYNTSADSIRPMLVPGELGITATLLPETVPPGEVSVIGITLDTQGEPRTGLLRYDLHMLVADAESPDSVAETVIGILAEVAPAEAKTADSPAKDERSGGKDSKKKGKRYVERKTLTQGRLEVRQEKDSAKNLLQRLFPSKYTSVKDIPTGERKKAKDKNSKRFRSTYTEVKRK